MLGYIQLRAVTHGDVRLPPTTRRAAAVRHGQTRSHTAEAHLGALVEVEGSARAHHLLRLELERQILDDLVTLRDEEIVEHHL